MDAALRCAVETLQLDLVYALSKGYVIAARHVAGELHTLLFEGYRKSASCDEKRALRERLIALEDARETMDERRANKIYSPVC